jgi:hypothetical protein
VTFCGAHQLDAERFIQGAACPAAGLGDQVPYRSTVVVIDLCPSQRETSEIGTPSARAVLAKVCRRSWNVVSSASPAAVRAGFQMLRL